MRPFSLNISNLFCVVNVAGLSDDRYLDLSGIVKLTLDLGCDVARKKLHIVVGNNLGLNHDSYLTACLNSEGLLYSLEVACNLLELLKSLDVVLNVLTASTGSCGADSICRLDNEVESRNSLNVVMVSLYRVNYVLILAVLGSCI